MEHAVERVRAAIESFRRVEADVLLARLRGDPEGPPYAAIARAARTLRSDETLAFLDETTPGVDFETGEREASAAHVARARAESVVCEGRDRLEVLSAEEVRYDGRILTLREAVARSSGSEDEKERRGWARTVEEAVDSIAEALLAARERADEAALPALAGVPPHPDAGPDAKASVERAERFLAETDDAMNELRSGWRAMTRTPSRWEDVAHALTSGELAAVFPARSRVRRIADDLTGLGFTNDLRARVRVEQGEMSVEPRARVILRRAPSDVRLVLPRRDLGLISELATADGLGRALALSLASPGLPVALARPVVGTVARCVGSLFVQLFAEPTFLRRRELPLRSIERVARQTTGILLAETRTSAASLLARRGGGTRQERVERAVTLYKRALGFELTRPLAALFALTPSGAGARFRSRQASLGVYMALRSKFDEDWYRNPRTAETIRGACARGGGLSVEALCVELGVGEGDAKGRIHELFAR